MNFTRRATVTLAFVSLTACGGDFTAPAGADLATAVQGDWAAEESLPGNSLGFNLHASGATVTGTGAFAGEAGPSGTVAITGEASASTLTLHFVNVAVVPAADTVRARFIGTLDANGRLVGSMKYGPENGEQAEYMMVFDHQAPYAH